MLIILAIMYAVISQISFIVAAQHDKKDREFLEKWLEEKTQEILQLKEIIAQMSEEIQDLVEGQSDLETQLGYALADLKRVKSSKEYWMKKVV